MNTLTIDVHFDFVCPWCLIGTRHLATARGMLAALRPDVQVRLAWHSQQLLDAPLEGWPYQSFYVARLGSAEAVAARRAQVQQAARAAGLALAFDRIRVMPNTAAAHDLVACAADIGDDTQRAALIDRVFVAYFIDGEDIGDLAVLQRLALDCGLPRDAVLRHIEDAQGRRSLRMRRSPARPAVGGVPYFVFDGSTALSGAAGPEVLLDSMLRCLTR